MNNSNTKSIFLAATCAIAVCLGVWFGVNSVTPPSKLEISGFAFPEPKKLENIDLLNQNSKSFDTAAFDSHWTFVYVGYTFCPDACPMSLTVMNNINDLLDKKNIADDVQLLFVSVDPERDTPDRLLEYTRYFNEKFMAATGDPGAINNFTDQVSAIYALPDDRSDPNYLVDHSSSIVLIDPDAAVHAIFTPPQVAADLASDFERLRDRYLSKL